MIMFRLVIKTLKGKSCQPNYCVTGTMCEQLSVCLFRIDYHRSYHQNSPSFTNCLGLCGCFAESRNIVHVIEFEIYQDDPKTLHKIVSR